MTHALFSSLRKAPAQVPTPTPSLEVRQFVIDALGYEEDFEPEESMPTQLKRIWQSATLRNDWRDAFISLKEGNPYDAACKKLEAVLKSILDARFSELHCVNVTQLDVEGQSANPQVKRPDLALLPNPESNKDWSVASAFTLDIARTAEEQQNLSEKLKERCRSIHAVSPRHKFYGAIIEQHAFHLWQFDPRSETLRYSRPIIWKSEEFHDPASHWADAVKSMTLALFRIVVQDTLLMQPTAALEAEVDDKPKTAKSTARFKVFKRR